jgi:hypothetical protein
LISEYNPALKAKGAKETLAFFAIGNATTAGILDALSHGVLTMYQPNFCSECGVRIVRAKWRVWTSRQFCAGCGTRFRKAQLALPLIAGSVLLFGGFGFGRYLRPPSPPLIIQRSALSPLSDIPSALAAGAPSALHNAARAPDDAVIDGNNQIANAEDVIYTCGARTKKGTPCSRRVHGPVRCWQHKGMPAMLPQEKLLVKE